MQVEHGARTEIVSDAEAHQTRAAEESDSTSVNANPVSDAEAHETRAAEESDSTSVNANPVSDAEGDTRNQSGRGK